MGPARSRPDHRIIPARAGFTGEPPPGRRPGRDHPRSRGVYPSPTCPTPTRSGSSPLARGLLSADAIHTIRPGIIPARAGFTHRPGRPGRRPRDHPRSRGVYAFPSAPVKPIRGSSPLARGLPAHPATTPDAKRIIPARAGFTRRLLDRHLTGADHPRSRGVYATRTRRMDLPGGSSPLARGLRLHHLGLAHPRRIIPARAGFTARQASQAGRRRDHPRSRGVYIRVVVTSSSRWGSSPLARGLRRRLPEPR